MKPIEAIKEILKNILISTALIAIIKNTSLEATIQNQPQNSYLRAKSYLRAMYQIFIQYGSAFF